MSKHQKIFFRADAGSTIGYGHFIRTLALADMLKDDFDCTFFTQTPTDYQLAEVAKVCRIEALPSDDSKFEKFIHCLSGEEIVVLDNYFFDTDYQRQIKAKGCKLVCIDDMHDKHYVADVVINHGTENADLFDIEPYTKLCLGLEWALLRNPFLEASKNITHRVYSEKIKRVAVCFGGSDVCHLTDETISRLLQQDSQISIDAIVGGYYQTTLTPAELDKIQFHQNISAQQVADIFIHCDLAILSASSVCIEALACGARVAAGWYVDNQKTFYEYLCSQKLIMPLSDWKFDASLQKAHFSSIADHYSHLFKNLAISGFEESGFRFVDYTLLTESQHKVIFDIRNSDQVRFCMVHPERFPFEQHLSFVRKLNYDYLKKYWAVYQDDQLVASVSLHPISWEERIGEWGIFMNPDEKGKGKGQVVASLFFKVISSCGFLKEILASVKKENQNSLIFHQKVGFKIDTEDKDYFYLKRKL